MQESDVIIIGGGVLGCSLAYHLGRQGKSVVLLEREMLPAMHASGKNAGMMRALYRNPTLTEWALESVQTWPEELRDSFFKKTGSLVVGRLTPDHHPEAFEQREHRLGNGKTQPAVYTPSDGLLDSPAYVNRLFALCDSSQVLKRLSETVQNITYTQGSWLLHCTSGRAYKAAQVVNAGGAWINDPLRSDLENLQVETRAYARHLLLVQGWPDGWMPTEDIGFYWDEFSGWYMRQWDKASRLVSICDQTPAIPERFVPAPDITERTAEKLLEALPSVASSLEIASSWHCFRTYTSDQLPIVGEDPEHRGFYWFAAFGGFGMSTSFAAARTLAAQICGENVAIPREFLPSRCRKSCEQKLQKAV